MAYDEGLAQGMVYVAPAGIESDAELARWVTICSRFVDLLPLKKPEKLR
jgi:hypothetical protein